MLHSVCYLSFFFVYAVCMILSDVSNVIRTLTVLHTGEMTSTTTPLPSTTTGNLVLSMCECVYLMALMPIKRSLSSEQAIDAIISGLVANSL